MALNERLSLFITSQLGELVDPVSLRSELSKRGVDPATSQQTADCLLCGPNENLSPQNDQTVIRVQQSWIPGKLSLETSPDCSHHLDDALVAAAIVGLPDPPEYLRELCGANRDRVRYRMAQEALCATVLPRAQALADLVVARLRSLPPTKARVSVVINNYNYASYLGQAIESVLSQTTEVDEVIVVDDGSTDTSRDVIARFPQVIPIFKDNGGQASAFNAGFARATADIVLFLDADDKLRPDAIRIITSTSFYGLSRLSFALQMIDRAGHPMGLYPLCRAMREGHLAGAVLNRGGFLFMPTSGNAFPRWALERILPMPERGWRVSADLYLCLASAFLGPARHLDQVLGDYRVHGANAFYHHLGAQPYFNPRKFAQRRLALKTLYDEMAHGRFGTARQRQLLKAKSLKADRSPVLRRFGAAWAWLQTGGDGAIRLRPTKLSPDEPSRWLPFGARRIAQERNCAVFGGESSWPLQTLGCINDLTASGPQRGVLGRNWRIQQGIGAELMGSQATLGLAFDGPLEDVDLRLDYFCDEPDAWLEFWVNGLRLNKKTLQNAGALTLGLPADLLEFDADIRAYVARLMIRCSDGSPGQFRLTGLTATRSMSGSKTAPWLVPSTTVGSQDLDPYLRGGWDWPTVQGCPLLADEAVIAFSIAGLGDHSLFLQFDGAVPALALQGDMVSPTATDSGAVAIHVSSSAISSGGLVILKCIALDAERPLLRAMRLDRIDGPTKLLPARPVPAHKLRSGASKYTFQLPDNISNCAVRLGFSAMPQLQFPASFDVQIGDQTTGIVLAAPGDVDLPITASLGEMQDIRILGPDGLDVAQMTLLPQIGSRCFMHEFAPTGAAQGIAKIEACPADWHPAEEGVWWLSGAAAAVWLELDEPRPKFLVCELLTLPNPPQILEITIGDQVAVTSKTGRTSMMLPLPEGYGPVELRFRSTVLVARAALGIEEPGFLGGALIALELTDDPARTAKTQDLQHG